MSDKRSWTYRELPKGFYSASISETNYDNPRLSHILQIYPDRGDWCNEFIGTEGECQLAMENWLKGKLVAHMYSASY